jgi:hypothetical protein
MGNVAILKKFLRYRLCPGCGRNAFRLFYVDGWFSGCYRCIGVPYASQQRSRKGRSRLQAARLR